MEKARRTAPEEIRVNAAEIPEWHMDRLAAATLALIRTIQNSPGGREALEAGTAARKEVKA